MSTKITRTERTEIEAKIDAFHRQRRMFVIGTFGDVTVAPKNYGASHAQWFQYDKVNADVRWTTRGFYDDTGLYAYKGEDFAGDESVKNELIRGLEAIGAPWHLSVYVGMKTGVPGERWEPLERIGTVGELIEAKPGIQLTIPMSAEALDLLLKVHGSPEAAMRFVLRVVGPGTEGRVMELLRKECRHEWGDSLACVQSNTLHECAICGHKIWD